MFLWGSVFPAIRLAMEAFDPAGMAAARYGTTSVVLALAALVWRPRLPRRPADLLPLGGLGLFGVFGYALALNVGELTLGASAASLVYNTTPVFTAPMAFVFLGERMGRGGWAGTALACVGVTIIATTAAEGVRFTQGAWFVLLATVFQAIAVVVTKTLLARRWTPFELTAWSIWLGTAFLLPVGWRGVVDLVDGSVSAAPTLAILYLAILPGLVAYVLWSCALTHVPAGRAAGLLSLMPVVATGLEVAWWGILPTWGIVARGAVTIAGAALTNAARFGGSRVKHGVERSTVHSLCPK
ncbi:DMT family transporter [Salinarimonas ramus]|uniref:Membrane protein n=1 Tax=Salinarimonas ramus TaxID=690164 RepID=A0A917V343_9HYPH|nr:DMT family transporter [Salinarimonas ramus]GGK27916.1 membrane protein [Salinarimonas ramus]